MEPLTTVASSVFSGVLIIVSTVIIYVRLRNGRLDRQPLSSTEE